MSATCAGCGESLGDSFVAVAVGNKVPGGEWHGPCIELWSLKDDWQEFVAKHRLPEGYVERFEAITEDLKSVPAR